MGRARRRFDIDWWTATRAGWVVSTVLGPLSNAQVFAAVLVLIGAASWLYLWRSGSAVSARSGAG